MPKEMLLAGMGERGGGETTPYLNVVCQPVATRIGIFHCKKNCKKKALDTMRVQHCIMRRVQLLVLPLPTGTTVPSATAFILRGNRPLCRSRMYIHPNGQNSDQLSKNHRKLEMLYRYTAPAVK